MESLLPFRAFQFKDLRGHVEASRESLEKIGDGDWTPQDTRHLRLVNAIDSLLCTAEAHFPELARGE